MIGAGQLDHLFMLLFLRGRKKKESFALLDKRMAATSPPQKKARKVIDVCPKVFNRWPLCR